MITVRTSPQYVNRVRQDWTDNGGVYGDGGVYMATSANNPFAQLGPTLDLTFAGVPTDQFTAATTDGYSVNLNLSSDIYQIAAQYAVWGADGLQQVNFSQVITFTRASTATFVGSDGLIQSAAIDVPRFDYDPVTLAARGLLIEESSTNLHLYSQDFSTGWTNSNTTDATLTAAAAAGLDGTTSAGSYLCSTTTDANRRLYASANITVSSTSTYTASCYVKPVNGWTWISFAVTGGTVTTNGIGGGTFNLSTGALGSTTQTAGGASGVTKSIFAVGNGWYRIVVSGTMDGVTTNLRPKIVLLDADESYANSAVGVVGAGVLVWGMQLEQKDFPTSYIPTTTTSLTRSADSALINTLSPWFNATEGTLYSQGDTGYISGNAYGGAFIVTDGTATNRVTTNIRSTQNGLVVTGGVTEASQTAGSVSVNTPIKVAYAYKTNDTQVAVGGALSAVDTAVNLPSGLNVVNLGNRNASVTFLNGHLQRVTYYPRRLSDAELQTITT